MPWQSDGVKKVKHRVYFLSLGMLIFSLLLFSRMFFLQVIDAEKYQTLAERNRIGFRQIAPARGLILDRNGEVLASNRKTFRAILTAERTGGNVSAVLEKFQRLVPLEAGEVERILKDVKRRKSFVPVRVKEDLTFEQMAAIQLNIPELTGISIEESLMRVYPEGPLSAHVIGYVSFLTEDDLRKNESLQKLPDARIGRTGVERSFEKDLAGIPGTRKMEINAVGREVRELGRQEATPGQNIQLSIDGRFQKIGFEAMRGEAGSALLMDVHTGEVLMFVSTPSFDPNIFNYPIDVKTWKELNENERHPMLNKAILGTYSPGSAFKIVVALAGLEAGVIKPSTKINCAGRLLVGDHPFHCWKKNGHGELDLSEALQHSCDIYFYEVARKVGVDKIADVAERLGFGEKTGIELQGERTGLLPSREWKAGRFGDAWRLGDTMNLGIGQGFLNSTPLQMVQMMARVANGGYAVRPTLLKQDENTDQAQGADLGFSRHHLAEVMDGLKDVVNKSGGTAYHTRINVAGQRMGGKTASTQIRHISLAEREEGLKQQHELAWKDRDHAFFVAYAPLDNPRYALAVAVEHGGGGGTVAAPIASSIMRQVLEIELADKKAAILERQKSVSKLKLKDKPQIYHPVFIDEGDVEN